MTGSTFGLFIRFPSAPHEGNGTGVVLVDETLPEPRRPVLESMIESIPPFSIFGVCCPHSLAFGMSR